MELGLEERSINKPTKSRLPFPFASKRNEPIGRNEPIPLDDGIPLDDSA